jgi:hypothetical protein
MKKAIIVILLALAAISPFMSWSHTPTVHSVATASAADTTR